MSSINPSLSGMVARTRQTGVTRDLAHRQLVAAARTPRVTRLGLASRVALARAVALRADRPGRARRSPGSVEAVCCA